MGLTFKGKAPTQRGGSPEPENPPHPGVWLSTPEAAGRGQRQVAPSAARRGKLRRMGPRGVSGFGDRRDRNDLGKNSFRGMDGARVVFQSVRDERVLG